MTFLPLFPLFNVPRFRFLIVRSTDFCAAFPWRGMAASSVWAHAPRSALGRSIHAIAVPREVARFRRRFVALELLAYKQTQHGQEHSAVTNDRSAPIAGACTIAVDAERVVPTRRGRPRTMLTFAWQASWGRRPNQL
jgi:hypothetical protein